MTSPKKLHIFGMAWDPSDLLGIHSPKLERDYLRLIFAVEQMRSRGENAIGYLSFINWNLAKLAIEHWNPIYGEIPHVSIIPIGDKKMDFQELLEESEKIETAILMKKRTEKPDYDISWNVLNRGLHVYGLVSQIRQNHPGVRPEKSDSLGIDWDFFGIFEPHYELPTSSLPPLFS